jgi:hypothetical protein
VKRTAGALTPPHRMQKPSRRSRSGTWRAIWRSIDHCSAFMAGRALVGGRRGRRASVNYHRQYPLTGQGPLPARAKQAILKRSPFPHPAPVNAAVQEP